MDQADAARTLPATAPAATTARHLLLRAAASLWLPSLLPFLFGPLTECGHCVRSYLALLPVQPGFLAVSALRDGPWLYPAGLLATALLLALVAKVIGAAGRRWPWVALAVAVPAGAQALVLGSLLRM